MVERAEAETQAAREGGDRMTPRLLIVIAAACLGAMVAALIVGDLTMTATALAAAMGFGIGADILRKVEQR